MSSEPLLREVTRRVDGQHLDSLEYTLERCRYGRYTLRSVNEQLMGDLNDCWANLRTACQKVYEALKESDMGPRWGPIRQHLQCAFTLQAIVVGVVAGCMPRTTAMRREEWAQQFLGNIARHRQSRELLSEMEAAVTTLAILQSTMESDPLHKLQLSAC